MKKKHYNEFLTLFDSISDARTLISGFSKSDLVSNPDLVEIKNSRLKTIENKFNKITKLGYAPSDNVFEEIIKNIKKCHSIDDKQSLLILILRDFWHIAPYLNIEAKKDNLITSGEQPVKIGENPYLEEYDCIHKLIGRHRKLSIENINITMPEDYILRCHSLYIFFFIRLDALAFDFNLDLSDIQNKLNLNIFKRNEVSLQKMGYLNGNTHSTNHSTRQNREVITNPKLPESLELLFDSISKYKMVMELLVSKKYINSHTYIWKDEKKGNKSFLAALIKNLHEKGYYKDDNRPENEQIKAICINTFRLDVGIDTIKHAKSDSFKFEFIPIASSIE